MNVALILSQADIFLLRHDRELDAWEKREKKRIATRKTDHVISLGQSATRASERLFYEHFAEDHIATLMRVRMWLDRPFTLKGATP